MLLKKYEQKASISLKPCGICTEHMSSLDIAHQNGRFVLKSRGNCCVFSVSDSNSHLGRAADTIKQSQMASSSRMKYIFSSSFFWRENGPSTFLVPTSHTHTTGGGIAAEWIGLAKAKLLQWQTSWLSTCWPRICQDFFGLLHCLWMGNTKTQLSAGDIR